VITLNICASRIPGMTHAEYCRYLKDNHARLVLGTEPVVRHMTAYVQQHVFDGAYGAKAPSARYDSVSHIVAARVEDHAAASATREYKEIIAPDEPRFSDGHTAMFLMFQDSPLDVPVRGPSGFRLLHYLARTAGTSADVLLARWAAAHAAILAEDPALLRSVRRASLHRALPGPGGEPAYDGMCELGFIAAEDAASLCSYAHQVEARLGGSIDAERSFFLLSEVVPVHGTIW
jgi:hypothetical protein